MVAQELSVAASRPELAQLPDGHRLMHAVHRHRWAMTLTFLMVLGCVGMWTFLTPKRYTSTMMLLVQNARGTEAVTSGEGGNTAMIADVSEEQLNSEVAVLGSDDVANEVIHPGWSSNTPERMTRSELVQQERAVRKLRSRLEVTPVRSSHVIEVSLSASSSEEARKTLNIFLQSFLRKQRQLGELPGAFDVFSQKADETERSLEAARTELAAYQTRAGFVSLQDEEMAIQQKLLDAETSERAADAEIADLEQRAKTDQQQLILRSERITTVENRSPSTGSLDQMRVLLVNLQNQRTALLTKFKPDDRMVQQVEKQIADTADALKNASAMSPGTTSTDVNPLWSGLQRDLDTTSVTLTGLRARRQRQSVQSEQLAAQLDKIEQAAGPYDVLVQRVAELESAYKAFQAKRDAAGMNALMDQQKWLNIAVVQYPTASMTAAYPQKRLNLLLGGVTALLLASCAAFLIEVFRQQVSTVAELKMITEHPVLASIPWSEELSDPQTERKMPATLGFQGAGSLWGQQLDPNQSGK